MRILLPASLLLLGFIMSCTRDNKVLRVTDDFNGTELSTIWDSRKFLEGAVIMQTTIVRAGTHAAKITLRPGDQIAQEKGTILERAEISEDSKFWSMEDSLYAYTFSIYLPADFPIDSTRLVIAQWKQECEVDSCTPDNPLIALRYIANKLFITLKGPDLKVIYETSENVLGRWLDFRFNIAFSRSDNGLVEAWLNNKKIVEYRGPNAYPHAGGYPDKNSFYFKTGLYRDRMESVMTIYFDEYSKERLPLRRQ